MDTAGRPLANFWQGLFPTFNSDQYGFKGRAPVGCFAANQFRVYDTVDNVKTRTNDGFTGARQPHGNNASNEIRMRYQSSYKSQQEAVIKGGSYLLLRGLLRAYSHLGAAAARKSICPPRMWVSSRCEIIT